MFRFGVAVSGFLLVGLVGVHAAQAADTSQAADRPHSVVQISPYMWASGLSGRVSPFQRGPAMNVEKSFSDIMDDFNVGGFVNIWGRHNNFVYSGDMMYVSTSGAHGSGPLPSFQIPGLGVVIPPGADVKAAVDTRQFTATAMGGYRVVYTPQITFDLLGGLRYWHISNDVTVSANLGPQSRTASHAEGFGWVDPLVGVRGFIPFTNRLSMQAQADMGGFGIGSKFTWDILATVNYLLTDHLSASLGYKIMDVNYNRNGRIQDTRLSGPVLGVTLRF